MASYRGPSGPGSVLSAVVLLVAVAVGARVVYELLAPLLPLLITIAVLGFIFSVLFRR